MEYYQLKESIQRSGVLTPLLVRGEEIVDGHTRRECAIDLNLTDVPVHEVQLSDWEVLLTQVKLNTNARTEEYVARIYRIMALEPELSFHRLVHYLSANHDWLIDLLNLTNLQDTESVFAGKIPLIVAIELAKLPKSAQKEIFEIFSAGDLTTLEKRDILVTEARRHRQSQKDARTNRNHKTRAELGPRYRSFKEVCHEVETPTAAASVLHRCNASDLPSWRAALKWVLSIDPETLETRRTVLTKSKTLEISNDE